MLSSTRPSETEDLKRAMKRACLRLGMIAGVLVSLAVATVGAQSWWHRHEIGLARAEIERREFLPALRRLESLAASRSKWVSGDEGELNYWLGKCRWAVGRRDEALATFACVPEAGDYGTLSAAFAAEALLKQGHWRAAEERLERALSRGGPGLKDVRDELEQLYRREARFEDAARLLRDGCNSAHDPVRVLRALWVTERGTPPFETIQRALDIGERLDPKDQRVWLGRARVAIQTGRLVEAETWLKRCANPPTDEPVWRAWLDWARSANRLDVARNALQIIGSERLGPVERLAWRAWFAQRAEDDAAERRALESWLTLEPRNPVILIRLAELVTKAGDLDRAAVLRGAKSEVDRCLDSYDQRMTDSDAVGDVAERLALGRLAEGIGRLFDARTWYTLALQVDPANAEARSACTRLESPGTIPVAALVGDPDPWDDSKSGTSLEVGTPSPELSCDVIPWFVDDAKAAGLEFSFRNGETVIRQMPVAVSGGVVLLDYDRDGWLDVYALQGGTFPPERAPKNADRLFHNKGDGTFEDVTERAGIAAMPGGYGLGAAVGDVDNDGRPDLLITRWRGYALYRNRGDGSFEDVTDRWGLGGDRDWPTSAAFADLDGDGDLDLYVCHYVVWDAVNPKLCRNAATHAFMSCNPKSSGARPDHVFRNDGGKFTDVSAQAGIVDHDGRGLGVIAADLDDDGRIDLFVANDKSANFLFRNLGEFRFEEVGHVAGVAANAEGGYQAGMGVGYGDLDGDGRSDLAVTNYYGESTTLYQNLGAGIFTDRTAASGLATASRLLLGFGIALVDVNNDGRLDILTANGHTDDLGDTPFRMPTQLLAGVGGGRLIDLSSASGPAILLNHVGRGLAVGDLDNDGRIDALLVAQNEPLVFLHNRTERAGHWVSFRLEGRRSNRDAVGTRVILRAGGRRLVADRFGGGSYLSANDPRLHFGLGASERIADVEVHWPSGQVDRHHDLEADAVYHLYEGNAVAKRILAGRH
jgi:enediyne biosynthesis protein E4